MHFYLTLGNLQAKIKGWSPAPTNITFLKNWRIHHTRWTPYATSWLESCSRLSKTI